MKTREIVKATLFVAGILILTSACNKKDDGPTLDFNITVPSSWIYYILDNDDNDVVYYAQSPKSTATDSIAEDLIVTKNEAPNMTLAQFYTAYVGSLDNDTSFHAETTIDTTINGEDAIKLIHSQIIVAVNNAKHDTAYLDAKIEKYFMLNNNNGYVVSLNALLSSYDDYKELFDDIISTFTFKN